MGRSGSLRRRFVLAVALVSGGRELAAQATGIPLRFAGFRGGIELALDVGFGKVRMTAPDEDHTSRSLGASAAIGFGPLGASLGLARANRSPGDDRTTLTGSAGLRVFGLPFVPLAVTWQGAMSVPLGGDGGASSGDRPWRGSLGLAASLTLPVPVMSIMPWLGPRLDYFGRQPVSGSRVKSALSAGIDFAFLSGLVIRTAYDSRLGWEPVGDAPSGFSLGVGYRVR